MSDFDALIIGAGQAGPSLAGRLNETGLKVAIIERPRHRCQLLQALPAQGIK